ncbi:MAG: hypothetical protein LBG13_00390 [Holosporales bacterium]|jgi:hypothetical protein|nr:hypothetical protein [Holosporales bacterium]
MKKELIAGLLICGAVPCCQASSSSGDWAYGEKQLMPGEKQLRGFLDEAGVGDQLTDKDKEVLKERSQEAKFFKDLSPFISNFADECRLGVEKKSVLKACFYREACSWLGINLGNFKEKVRNILSSSHALSELHPNTAIPKASSEVLKEKLRIHFKNMPASEEEKKIKELMTAIVALSLSAN